jgi:hypothetical protein
LRPGTARSLPGILAAADLPATARVELARIDAELCAIWNLGQNVLLAWTQGAGALLVLAVRHHAIPEAVHVQARDDGIAGDAPRFIRELLAGPKHLEPGRFHAVCAAFERKPDVVRLDLPLDSERLVSLVSEIVRRYGVTLVHDRAVVLLDAVQFSLHSPLDQMAMLNSLAYSVNSGYAQLLSKDIRIDFARTTTGDGFYIWNRATTPGANAELYKLMMLLLADNVVARTKARSSWVPRLRAAFHVGEHYEFHQVEGLNPTNISYIVGRVTVDLARMLDHALPGQILLGDFTTGPGSDGSPTSGAMGFVANTAATLEQLNGLEISGGRIEEILCYLTGQRVDERRFLVDRYHLLDKHGTTRTVFNAKINIKRDRDGPIYLGIRNEELRALPAWRAEPVEPLAAAFRCTPPNRRTKTGAAP